jgi:hypothetical protein
MIVTNPGNPPSDQSIGEIENSDTVGSPTCRSDAPAVSAAWNVGDAGLRAASNFGPDIPVPYAKCVFGFMVEDGREDR